jgi:hypothetical protein
MCLWDDDFTLRVRLGTHAVAKVGDAFSIVPGILKSKCPPAMLCTKWKTTQASTVIIGSPDRPIVPKVSIVAPNIIGACTSLLIDASASSGSGGRAWGVARFEVTSDDPKYSMIQEYMNGAEYTIYH